MRGDPHDIIEPLAYFVWAIVGPHGTFIVDTGFDRGDGRQARPHDVRPVVEGLKALDIAADEVKDVIITHLHYDHCGNHDLFPRARYHLQDVEMAYATGRCMCHAELRIPFEADDVVAMVRKVFDGRVAFHDGDDELAPGITVHHIGGHSKGLQCVRVKTRARRSRAGVGRDAPLRAFPRGPCVPDHLQRRRYARGIRDAEPAGGFARPHRARARPDGHRAVSCGAARPRGGVVRLDVAPTK